MLDVSSIPSYPVLPLRDIVVFPHMIVPLFVGREKSVAALETVMKDDKQILLVAQKNASQDEPAPKDIHSVGVVGSVLQLLKLPDGTVKVLVEGGARARIVEFQDNPAFFEARAEKMAEDEGNADELEALGRSVTSQFEQYVKLNKKVPPEVLVSVNQIEEPSKLADTIASHLSIKLGEKQELLEIGSVSGRLERVISLMEGEIGVLQVEKRIRSRVKRQMEKTQREYYLNEQMKAIQKELGEGEDGRDEAAEFEARIKATKLTKEAREKSLAEVRRQLTDDAELVAVRRRLSELSQRLEEQAPARRPVELRIRDIEDRLKTVDARLYGGSITNQRELEAQQEQQNYLREQHTAEEDQLLEMMVASEETQNELEAAASLATEMETRRKQAQPELTASEEALSIELRELEAERKEVAALISPADLALYDSLRKSRGGKPSPESREECARDAASLCPAPTYSGPRHRRGGSGATAASGYSSSSELTVPGRPGRAFS